MNPNPLGCDTPIFADYRYCFVPCEPAERQCFGAGWPWATRRAMNGAKPAAGVPPLGAEEFLGWVVGGERRPGRAVAPTTNEIPMKRRNQTEQT